MGQTTHISYGNPWKAPQRELQMLAHTARIAVNMGTIKAGVRVIALSVAASLALGCCSPAGMSECQDHGLGPRCPVASESGRAVLATVPCIRT